MGPLDAVGPIDAAMSMPIRPLLRMRLLTIHIRAWPLPMSMPEAVTALALLSVIWLAAIVMSEFLGLTLSTSRMPDRALPEMVSPVRVTNLDRWKEKA